MSSRCSSRSSRRFGKARIAVAVAASLAASPGIDAQQPRPTLRLVASHPYPAVQRPTDIYPEPQGDHFWTLVRDGQKMAVARDGAAPAQWFDAIVAGTLSWDPDSGIPRFFARRAGGGYSVAGTVRARCGRSRRNRRRPGHVAGPAFPVFTSEARRLPTPCRRLRGRFRRPSRPFGGRKRERLLTLLDRGGDVRPLPGGALRGRSEASRL